MPATTPIALTHDAYLNGILGTEKWAVQDFTFSFPTNQGFYEWTVFRRANLTPLAG